MKWHKLIEGDPTASLLHRACRALHAAEDLWVEGLGDQIYLELERARVYIPLAFSDGGGVIDELRERYRESVEILVEEPPPTSIGFRDAYHAYVELLRTKGDDYVKQLRRLTEERGREHAFIVFLDHDAAILLEGEGDRIVLPEVRSCVFMHTHPGPYCYPSPNDIRSSVGFFSNGGIVEQIVSSTCIWSLWRSWLLAEEDIEALFETADLLEKAYRGKRVTNPLIPLTRTVFHTSIEQR